MATKRMTKKRTKRNTKQNDQKEKTTEYMDRRQVKNLQQASVTAPRGWVQLDIRLDEDVKDPYSRHMLRQEFINVSIFLTGLADPRVDATQFGAFAEFLRDTLTYDHGAMPSNEPAMLEKLNTTYWTHICSTCQDLGGTRPRLYDCDAIEAPGPTFYCYGTDGERYCYHSFGVAEKGTGIPVTVGYAGHVSPVLFTCVGPADT